jgi:hypothetical protein
MKVKISRTSPISLISAFDAQAFFIDAAVTVHSTAYSTFLNRKNVILVSRFTARHAGKILSHNYTPLLSLSWYSKK